MKIGTRLGMLTVVVACGAPLALTAGSGLAFAQSSIPQSVRNILAAPSALLESNPTGGPRLASQVRDVAVADKAGLQVLINLLANANKDQKSAIGAGLGQAARLVVRSDPTYAAEIQRVVAETKDQDAVLAYASAAGDQPIGAGGAGAGSSGAVGGQTNALPSGPYGASALQSIGGPGVATGPFTYTSSVSGLSATGIGGTTLSINGNVPVSP